VPGGFWILFIHKSSFFIKNTVNIIFIFQHFTSLIKYAFYSGIKKSWGCNVLYWICTYFFSTFDLEFSVWRTHRLISHSQMEKTRIPMDWKWKKESWKYICA
jgi:hypothetical protein